MAVESVSQMSERPDLDELNRLTAQGGEYQ